MYVTLSNSASIRSSVFSGTQQIVTDGSCCEAGGQSVA